MQYGRNFALIDILTRIETADTITRPTLLINSDKTYTLRWLHGICGINFRLDSNGLFGGHLQMLGLGVDAYDDSTSFGIALDLINESFPYHQHEKQNGLE